MNDAVITLKTDSELKLKAMKLADDLGFSLSSLINAYLKHFTRTKAVNFTLSEEPSQYLIDSIEESKADYKAGRFISFNTPGEEIDYLNKLIKNDENRIRSKISKTAKKGPIKYKETISREATRFSPQSI